jgi:hypothetical protein
MKITSQYEMNYIRNREKTLTLYCGKYSLKLRCCCDTRGSVRAMNTTLRGNPDTRQPQNNMKITIHMIWGKMQENLNCLYSTYLTEWLIHKL